MIMEKIETDFMKRLDRLIKNQKNYKLGKSLGKYYKEIISYCSSRI